MLESKRLYLRHAKIEDIKMILPFRNSEFVLRYNCMLPCGEEELEKEIMQDTCYVMALKDSDEPIGIIDLHEDSLRYRILSKELSYYLNEKYAQNGYMKEALACLIKELFVSGMECVSARAFTANVASHKLLLSLGFHQDGVIPKCVKAYQDVVYDDGVYSLLKEEYMEDERC